MAGCDGECQRESGFRGRSARGNVVCAMWPLGARTFVDGSTDKGRPGGARQHEAGIRTFGLLTYVCVYVFAMVVQLHIAVLHEREPAE